jgi:hypothetical protein
MVKTDMDLAFHHRTPTSRYEYLRQARNVKFLWSPNISPLVGTYILFEDVANRASSMSMSRPSRGPWGPCSRAFAMLQ